jgi:hypothetical protein
MKLRDVFRNYSDLKRDPAQAQITRLVWYNGKELEAWFFEPTEFNTTRDASSPFTYNYEIRGTLVQKVYFSSVVTKLNPRFGSIHFYLDALRTAGAMLDRMPFFTDFLGFGSGPDSKINTVIGAVRDLNGAITSAQNGGFNLIKNVGAVPGAFFLLATGLVTAAQTVVRSGKQALDAIDTALDITEGDKDRLKKTFLDSWTDIQTIATNTLRDGQEALKILKKNSRSGADTSLLDFSRYDSKGSTQGALNLKDYDLQPFIIPSGVKDLKAFVLGKLGNLHYWETIKKINKIDYPYIAGHPSKKSSGSSVKNPGDFILLPIPAKFISSSINTILPYASTGLNFFEETMGRDIKLTKTTPASGVSQFNLSISPNGDLDLIEGIDNMSQAIDVKINTARGDLPLHPSFGIIPVIGAKGNLRFNLFLSLNDTMLSDGRIEDLSDVSLNILGDIVNIRFKANLIGQLPYVPVDIAAAG